MELGPPPGFSQDCRNDMSISELISDLRTAFRSSDFDRVEEILVIKENKLKKKIEKMESEHVKLDLELKRLREDSSEKRILRENYEIMQQRVKVAEERAVEAEERGRKTDEGARVVEERGKVAEEKARELGERVRVVEENERKAHERARIAEERFTKADERGKLAEERSRKFEDRLERLLKDVKKNEKEKVDEIAQIKEKNKVLESEKIKAEQDVDIWKKKFEELEKRVTSLEAEIEDFIKLNSMAPRGIATCSLESNKAIGEKDAGRNDGFAVVSGSPHLPSPSTVSRNQDFPSNKKSVFEQRTIVISISDSDDESSPLRSGLPDKEYPQKIPDREPIDLTDWDIKPLLSKRKRPSSPNLSGSKMKLDGSTVNNMPDTVKFEVSSSSDSDESIDLDNIILESQKLI